MAWLHRHAGVGLSQEADDLFFRKTLLHGMTPHPTRGPYCRILYLSEAQFSGAGDARPLLHSLRRTRTLGTSVGTSWARRGLAGVGAPGGIRTPDTRLRKPVLYPTELRARFVRIFSCGRVDFEYRPRARFFQSISPSKPGEYWLRKPLLYPAELRARVRAGGRVGRGVDKLPSAPGAKYSARRRPARLRGSRSRPGDRSSAVAEPQIEARRAPRRSAIRACDACGLRRPERQPMHPGRFAPDRATGSRGRASTTGTRTIRHGAGTP
jgi:hypothetical protein